MWLVWASVASRACSIDIEPPAPPTWQSVPLDGATGVPTGAVVRLLPVGEWSVGPVELGGRVRLVDERGLAVDVTRTAWNGRVDLTPRYALRPHAVYAVEELGQTGEDWRPLVSFRTGDRPGSGPVPSPSVTGARGWAAVCGGVGSRVAFEVE